MVFIVSGKWSVLPYSSFDEARLTAYLISCSMLYRFSRGTSWKLIGSTGIVSPVIR